MPLPRQTTPQIYTNDGPLYKEESKLSMGEYLCIAILNPNINVSSNCSIKIMNCLRIKNLINTPLHLQLSRDFPVYCKIRLQK